MAKRTNNPWSIIEPRLNDIRMMRQSGYEMTQIAESFGIHEATLRKLARTHDSLKTALKDGTKELVIKLEDAAYSAALGLKRVKKIKKIYVPDRNDASKVVLDRIEETEEQQPVQPGLLVFLLKNLTNGKYVDRREYVDAGEFNKNIDLLKDMVGGSDSYEADKPAE